MVYAPGVASANIILEDDITFNDVYVHKFTFHYIIPDVIPEQNEYTSAAYDFGKEMGYLSVVANT